MSISKKIERKGIHKLKAVYIFIIIVFNFFLGSTLAMAQSYGILTQQQIDKSNADITMGDKLRVQAKNDLVALANRALTKVHSADVPLHSYAYYGATQAELDAVNNTSRALADNELAFQLASAYKITGNKAYADKAIYFLNAWATSSPAYIVHDFVETGDAPDFRRWDSPGFYDRSDADMSMCSTMVGFLQAAMLLEDYPAFTPTIKTKFNAWMTKREINYKRFFLPGEAGGSDWALPEWPHSNQTASALLFKVMLDAWRGDTTALNSYDVTYLKKQLDAQIEPLTDSGYNIPHMLPIEVRRGKNAMWYTAWTLETLTGIAEVLQNETGVDLFQWKNKHGSSIGDALNKFFIYIKNPDQWPYLEGKNGTTKTGGISRVPLPNSWGGTTYEAMGHKYNKPEWTAWATDKKASVFFGTSRTTWTSPTLFQPLSLTDSRNNIPTIESPKATYTNTPFTISFGKLE